MKRLEVKLVVTHTHEVARFHHGLRRTLIRLGWMGLIGMSCGMAHALDEAQPGAADWVGAVLRVHPLVRARQDDARAAGADVQAARWQYWPTPSVNTDTLRGQAASVARLSQPVWDGGKISAGITQAEIKQQLAVTSLHETEHELALKVLGYWQTHSVQSARAQVLERGMQSLQDLDALMSRRTEAGVSAQADLTLARVRLMQTRADLLQARAARTAARTQLRELAQQDVLPGAAHQGLPVLPDPQDGVDPLRDRARLQHPVVARLRWQLQLQQAELAGFKAELWPTLSLRAEHQRGQIDGTLAEGKRLYASLQYSLGAGVSVMPRLEAAQVRAQALESQQAGALKELDERLLQDWQDYIALRQRLPDLENVQATAQELTESSKRLFVAGRKSWLDLQNALREQLQAELAWTEAQAIMQALHYRLALHAGVVFWRPEAERP